jgi:RNA polymerase sigma-70 factor (ECF subfamily)
MAPAFATTHWSVVLRAGGQPSAESAQALDQLCRAYWYPLYAYVRRQGYDREEARDLTQEFFSRLLARDLLGQADPQRGRFRAFLLTMLNHFLADEWRRAHRQKRGGNCLTFSLDEAEAERRFALEPADPATPETLFDRRWAEAILEQVYGRLRTEFDAGDRARHFDELKRFLFLDDRQVSYAEAAARLEMKEDAVRSAIYRLRRRYAALFRETIAHTVATPGDVDGEIRHLFAVLGGA